MGIGSGYPAGSADCFLTSLWQEGTSSPSGKAHDRTYFSGAGFLMWVTPKILAAVAVISLVLVLAAPLHTLLIFDLLLAPLRRQTEISGVFLDQTDVIFAFLALGFVLRRRLTFREIRARVPYFWLWLLVGIGLSVAYLSADIHERHLTAFHRGVYQVYRSSWKPILYFPLAAILLNTAARSKQALVALVLAGDLCALMAIPQGMQGYRAWGPFGSGNTLGAVLIVPVLISFSKLVFPSTAREKWFYGVSLLIVVRAALYASSRGAFAGMLVGAAVILSFLAARSKGRGRLLRLVPAGLLMVLVLFAWKPDLLQRPNVRRAFTLTNPMEEETFQWRLEKRWDFYWQKALQQPWLGYGTDVDPSLKVSGAKTPHNSYLSLVVENGFPAAILYLWLVVLSLWRGLSFFRSQPASQESFNGLLFAAAILGILTHFMADSLIDIPQVSKPLWLLAGLSACLKPIQEEFEESPKPASAQTTAHADQSTVVAHARSSG